MSKLLVLVSSAAAARVSGGALLQPLEDAAAAAAAVSVGGIYIDRMTHRDTAALQQVLPICLFPPENTKGLGFRNRR